MTFDFGSNWKKYSSRSLNKEKLRQAESDLDKYIGQGAIKDKTMLDLGCGSGIHALSAIRLGAKEVVGIDLSASSIETSRKNAELYGIENIRFEQGSILEPESLNLNQKFDIVYSWGVLHHTGNMKMAIHNATQFVAQDGILAIAIYARHWTSPIWKIIKMLYNKMPGLLQRLWVYFFCVVIYLTKFAVTGRNPLNKRRGMSFYYDVIDWVGGYPYEYSSRNEMEFLLNNYGFELKKFRTADVPTGCHEYLFSRQKKSY